MKQNITYKTEFVDFSTQTFLYNQTTLSPSPNCATVHVSKDTGKFGVQWTLSKTRGSISEVGKYGIMQLSNLSGGYTLVQVKEQLSFYQLTFICSFGKQDFDWLSFVSSSGPKKESSRTSSLSHALSIKLSTERFLD